MTQEEPDLRKRLKGKITSYPNLSQLFEDKVPDIPDLQRSVYRDPLIEQTWGGEFRFWNLLLHDFDPQFNTYLQEMDVLVAKCKAAYGEERLRPRIEDDFFNFLSELQVYETFLSSGVIPRIEPTPTSESRRKLELSVTLDKSEILIEVITPRVPEKMIRMGTGSAPWDLNLSKKIASEIAHHFDEATVPMNSTLIAVNGIFSGLTPINTESVVDAILNLKEVDFPNSDAELAKMLASKAAVFVSAVLLYKSNWGRCLVINPKGPQLTQIEISRLKEIFQVPN